MKKRKTLLVSLSMLFGTTAFAQVGDVSLTFTPQVGYNWFDKKSNVDNGTMYGFQAGFGFGKVIELRGTYERSFDLKRNFGKYEGDIQNLFPNFNFENREVKVSRIGGEFKTNLPVSGFAPYLIVGTGVQTFKTNLTSGATYKSENLYGSGGLGFKISLGERTTLNFEGRGLVYNMNPASLLYNEGGSSEFDEWVNNTDRSTMYNWSLMAGLQFYLGGRSETEMDAVERAYLNRYSGGISGTKLTLSPAGAFVNFNNNSPFRDTYLMGGIVGVDFSHYAGIQGYYYQATTDEKIHFDFDKLAMYGADFVGKLNVPRGIVPYITVGGGYINVKDNYQGRPMLNAGGQAIGAMPAKSGYYAKGGVGVSVPLSPNLEVFGAANLLYSMKNQDGKVEDIQNANELLQSTMYNAGLRLKLGTSANPEKAIDRAYDKRFDSERSAYDAQIAALQDRLNEKTKSSADSLKATNKAYEARLKALEDSLKDAYTNNDSRKAQAIIEEKKALEADQKLNMSSNGLVRLTPAELESLIERVIKGVDKQPELTVDDRLRRIEQLLTLSQQPSQVIVGQPLTTTQGQVITTVPSTTIVPGTTVLPSTSTSTIDERLIRELNEVKKELEELKKSKTSTEIQSNVTDNVVNDPVSTPSIQFNIDPTLSQLPIGYVPYIGFNFGKASTVNLGVRRFYTIQDSKVMFMPEAYIGLGEEFGFGISANVIYPFKTQVSGFTPYLGVGLGMHQLGDFKVNTNIIGGISYPIGNSKLIADYTIRGAFRNNQLGIGYSFAF
ncbi:MAG: hypothetical protein EOO99_08755 [Pedobacter sp.]|nr:MAG: hypothetical protein EOO99_08755 [Pedobacter sp.]